MGMGNRGLGVCVCVKEDIVLPCLENPKTTWGGGCIW
jgi:hypothetical protein